MQIYTGGVHVLHVPHDAAAVLAQLHQAAHIIGRGIDMRVHERLLGLGDLRRIGVIGGVVDEFYGTVCQRDAVFHAGGGGDKVQVELALQALDDDLQMQKAKKAAPEAKAQRHAGLCVKAQGRIVQAKLFQRVLQVGIIRAVGGINAAEHHRRHLAVAGQRLSRGSGHTRDGVAHAGVLQRFDGRGKITYLTRLQRAAGSQRRSAHMADLHGRELSARLHQLHGLAHGKAAVEHAQIDDDALVGVVHRVEDQRFQRRICIAFRRGDIGDDTLQNILDAHAHFGGDAGCVHARQTDHVLHLVGHAVRLGAGQVDLVQDGHQLQIVLQRKVGVGQRLRFHALAGVHHQHSALAGGQTSAHFVVEVHMARRVDEVELVILPVLCRIVQGNGARLDGDAALALQLHVIQKLGLHLALVHGLGTFQDAVGQGGLAVVDMGDDAEIADVFLCQGAFLRRIRMIGAGRCCRRVSKCFVYHVSMPPCFCFACGSHSLSGHIIP